MSKEIESTKKKSHDAHGHDQERINWVGEWEPVRFNADPDDRERIREIKKKIRVHTRGHLAEHNAENGTKFIVEEFDFERRSESPLTYKVRAFLNPPARTSGKGPGGHLIPPEPPQPPNNL